MNFCKKIISLLSILVILATASVPVVGAAPRIKSKSKPSLSLSVTNATTIKLKWKKFSDADGYTVYRKASKSGKWKKIKTTSNTYYSNKSLKVNKKYYYRVRAYDKTKKGKKYSPYSSTKSITTYVAKPTIKVSKKTSTSVKLSIKKNKGADGVVIYRKTSKNGSWKKLTKTTKSSYTNKSLKDNKTYYYRVKAYEKVGKKYYYSKYTKTLSAKTTKKITTVKPPQPTVTSPATIGNIKIKSGKSILDGLDFGGKTFTMAIDKHPQYNSNTFKRTVAEFENLFNCKIKIITLDFGTYNNQIAQLIASGNSPEICYAHGSMFPQCAINGIYNPLNSVISSGDLINKANPLAGGIDPYKTSHFIYKGSIYGTCNYSSCFPYVIYYNKKQMAERGYTGAKDPRTMAEHGQWTFDTIMKIGRNLTNGDDYFCSNSFMGRGVPLAYGAPIVTLNNGIYTENISSVHYIEGMTFLQRLALGSNAIMEPRDTAHPYNSSATLLKGSAYLWLEESYKYLDLSKEVVSSAAFNRSKENIGITTIPLGPTNTKRAYPTGWLTAICSGKGTDPTVAVAWDVFRSTYKDPIRDANALSLEDQAFVDGLLKGNISFEVGCFYNGSDSTLSLTEGGIVQKVASGSDVTQSVNSIKNRMTACINATMLS